MITTMLKSASILLLVLLPTFVWAALADDEANWKLVSRNDGIMVYTAKLPDEHLKTFRGVTTMQLDDFTAIAAFMDDYDFVASWMHMVSTIDGISRTSPDNRLVYVTTRLPWPVSDRDVVLHVGIEQDAASYAVRLPFHDVKALRPPEAGYVRMPQMRGFYLFKPLAPGQVEVTLQVIVDPGGYIPDWIANLIMRDIPYYSLKHLRVVANDPRFRNSHLDYYKVPPAWLETAKSKPVSGSSSSALP